MISDKNESKYNQDRNHYNLPKKWYQDEYTIYNTVVLGGGFYQKSSTDISNSL